MTPRGAVLAGGAASRFGGRPKGLELVGGARILDRVTQAIQEAIGQPPLLVANAPDARSWRDDLEVKGDVIADCGCLGGVYTAVVAQEGPVLVVAWDMPFVSADLLSVLAQQADDFDVFLPESDGPRGLEPLCGIYGPACATVIRQHLEDEDFRATGFHDEVRLGSLSRNDVARHGDPATQFFNVNTAEDLARAEEMWRALHA